MDALLRSGWQATLWRRLPYAVVMVLLLTGVVLQLLRPAGYGVGWLILYAAGFTSFAGLACSEGTLWKRVLCLLIALPSVVTMLGTHSIAPVVGMFAFAWFAIAGRQDPEKRFPAWLANSGMVLALPLAAVMIPLAWGGWYRDREATIGLIPEALARVEVRRGDGAPVASVTDPIQLAALSEGLAEWHPYDGSRQQWKADYIIRLHRTDRDGVRDIRVQVGNRHHARALWAHGGQTSIHSPKAYEAFERIGLVLDREPAGDPGIK